MSHVIGFTCLVALVAGLPLGMWTTRRQPTTRSIARRNDRHLARLARKEPNPMAEDRSANWCHSHNCPLGQCPTGH